MDFNGIWNAIEPYVIGVLTALMSGGMIFILVKQILSGWLNKNNLETLADNFAKSVVGEKIYVDIKALSDKRIIELNKEIKDIIESTLNKNLNVIDNVTAIVADVGEIFINSKTVTDTQRTRLKSDVEAIRSISDGKEKSDDAVVVELSLDDQKDKARLISFD